MEKGKKKKEKKTKEGENSAKDQVGLFEKNPAQRLGGP